MSRPIDDRLIDKALDGADGARWLFSEHIEPLCDTFNPALQHSHDHLMAVIINAAARSDARLQTFAARQLRLNALQVRSDLLTRLTEPINSPPDLCVIPSRVTIGADLTVTATMIAVVRAAWPQTRVAILGPTSDLLAPAGRVDQVEMWPVCYPRRGGVVERLHAWLDAVETTAWRTSTATSTLVLDPDSRITQLGLLSLSAPNADERFFRSRSFPTDDGRSLCELAEHWTRDVCRFDQPLPRGPRLALPDATLRWADTVLARMRWTTGRPIVVMSLGVGGNDRKAASIRDEVAMLQALSLRAVVLVDSGATSVERDRAAAVVAGWRSLRDLAVEHIHPGENVVGRDGVGLLHHASVTEVACLVSRADAYAGYDSAFHHIATDLRTPAVAVFVDPPSSTFVARWSPPGTHPVVLRPGETHKMAATCADAVESILGQRPGQPVERR